MTSTIIPALNELTVYDKVNVIDVGAAKGAFMQELEKIVDKDKIYSIGIDPKLDGDNLYDKFIVGCVDNVSSPTKVVLLVTSDEQASTICNPTYEPERFERQEEKVDVFNLDQIIQKYLPDVDIHFIKIDAEGKDYSILESLQDDTLKRVVFISVECMNGYTRFEEEKNKCEVIEYMKSKNFDVFYEHETNNGSNISDVVFKNVER